MLLQLQYGMPIPTWSTITSTKLSNYKTTLPLNNTKLDAFAWFPAKVMQDDPAPTTLKISDIITVEL